MSESSGVTTTKFKEVITILLIIVALIGIGFLLGRCTKEEVIKTEIEYLPGETIHDSIPYPVPYKVVEPADTASIIEACVRDGIYFELFPEKEVIITKDSIIYVPDVDTTAIVMDWATKRMYSEVLFDSDTLGTCSINAKIQYNRMLDLKYEFTPVHKSVVDTKQYIPLFSPYIGAGYGSYNTVMVRAGTYIKERVGIDYQFQHNADLKINQHMFGINYKF